MATTTRYLRNGGRYLWSITSLSVWACATAIFLNDNVFEISNVIGESMSPCLSADYTTTGQRDRVLWRKTGFLGVDVEELKKGDVVLFRSPHDPERNAVKRIVATEGDVVLLDPRRRPVGPRDGADVPESRAWDVIARGGRPVPEGHVWVEGDYWRKSWDSNAYGPISKSLILGKATAVVWPWRKFGTQPWEGFEGETKVVPGRVERRMDEMDVVEAIRYG